MFKKYKLRSYNFRLAILVIVASLYGIVVINSRFKLYIKTMFGISAWCRNYVGVIIY